MSSMWMVSSILLFLEICSSISSSIPSSSPTYEWQDHQTNEKLVCRQCPPGTSVAQHCTKDTPTLCKPCPSLYYTQYWNYLEDCLYCNVFCDNLEVEAQQCNGTHNRACQCKPGYYSDSDFCLPHSKCPLGSGVVRPGNHHKDTQCAPCAPGTYSSHSLQPCQPHHNCSKEGLKVNVPGNQFHDTFCTSCNISIANALEELAAGTGNRECQEAMIDLVPYEIRSHRSLLYLMRWSGFVSPQQFKKSTLVLQVELHAFLMKLKNTLGVKEVAQKLLKVLQKRRFTRLQKRFFS